MWLVWEQWSQCEPKCGFDRVRKRSRKCPPINYEKEHDDNSTLSCYFNGDLGPEDFQLCEFVPCPNESKWSAWEAWSDCSKNCGPSYRHRNRHCFFKFDMNNNNNIQRNQLELFKTPCIGISEEFKYCNLGECSGDLVNYVLLSIIGLLIVNFCFIVVNYFKHFFRLFKKYRENSLKKKSFIKCKKSSYRSRSSVKLERYSVASFHKNSMRKSTGKVSVVSSKGRRSLAMNRKSKSEI